MAKTDDTEETKKADQAVAETGPPPKPGPEIAKAHGVDDITAGFVHRQGLLMSGDSVLLKQLGGDVELYREVLRDDQVKSTVTQRFDAVVARSFEVEPGGESEIDKKAADFVRAQLQAVGFDRVTRGMLWGVFFGYAVAEVLYQWVDHEGQKLLGWKAIKVRKRQRFGFGMDNDLRMLTRDNMTEGKPCDPRYFWHYCTGADNDDEPYGVGLAHWLYWPVLFKRNGIKFWMVFLDKFGAPTPVGSYPQGSSQPDKDALLNALASVHTDAAVIIPDTMKASLLEAARSGTSDYATMCRYMDAAIAKVVLGQTLTTEVGSTGGNRALGEVHMTTRDEIAKSDSDVLCESLNRGPVRILVEANFAGAKPPRVYRNIDPPKDLKSVAETDEAIGRMGWERTDESFAETYGEGYQRKPEPEPPEFGPDGLPLPPQPGAPGKPGQPPKPGQPGKPAKPGNPTPKKKPGETEAEFAAREFPDQATLDAMLDELDNGRGFDSLDGALKPVFSFLEEHGPHATLARFVELYPLKVRQLQDRLAKLMFIADIWGRVHGRD